MKNRNTSNVLKDQETVKILNDYFYRKLLNMSMFLFK